MRNPPITLERRNLLMKYLDHKYLILKRNKLLQRNFYFRKASRNFILGALCFILTSYVFKNVGHYYFADFAKTIAISLILALVVSLFSDYLATKKEIMTIEVKLDCLGIAYEPRKELEKKLKRKKLRQLKN